MMAAPLQLAGRGRGRSPQHCNVVGAPTVSTGIAAQDVVGSPDLLEALAALRAHCDLSQLQCYGQLCTRQGTELHSITGIGRKISPETSIRKSVIQLNRRAFACRRRTTPAAQL